MNSPQWLSEWRLSHIVAALAVSLVPSAARAQASLDGLWGVYPAELDGGLVLHGVVRPANFETSGGAALEILVSAAGDGETTAARRSAGADACADCTAKHAFLLPEGNRSGQRSLGSLVNAPLSVTYIRVDGKEYALAGVGIRWTRDGPILERATLTRTGFVPPIFKGRIKVYFDARLDPGHRADAIMATALADVAESDRRAQEAYEASMRAYRELPR